MTNNITTNDLKIPVVSKGDFEHQKQNLIGQVKLMALKDAENSFNVWLSKNEIGASIVKDKATIIINDLSNYYFELYKVAFEIQEMKN